MLEYSQGGGLDMKDWLTKQFTTFPTFSKLGRSVRSAMPKVPDSLKVLATDIDLGVRGAASGARGLAKSLATPKGALSALALGAAGTATAAEPATSIDEQVALDSKTRPAIVQTVKVEREPIMSLAEYKKKHPDAKYGEYSEYALAENAKRAGERAEQASERARAARARIAERTANAVVKIQTQVKQKTGRDISPEQALQIYEAMKARARQNQQSNVTSSSSQQVAKK